MHKNEEGSDKKWYDDEGKLAADKTLYVSARDSLPPNEFVRALAHSLTRELWPGGLACGV